jgi:protein disulfide-isomerase
MRGVNVSRVIGLATALSAAGLFAVALRADDAVHWESNIETAKRIAAQTNRLVLVHFWAPWCGPCMRLESTVFNQPAVARDIEARFVPVKMNADDWPATARNFAIDRLPTDVIVAPNGRVLNKLGCPADANQYVAQLSQAAATAQGIAAVPPPSQRPFNASPAPTVPLSPNASPYAMPGSPVVTAPTVAPPTVNAPSVSNIAPLRPSIVPAATVSNPVAITASNRPMSSDASAFTGGSPTSAAGVTGGNSFGGPNGPKIVNAQSGPSPSTQPLGLDGFCPVTLIERSRTAPDDPRCWIRGDPRWGAVHRGATYLFNGPEEQKRFLANPDRYAPALGGNDAVLAFDRAKLIRGRREFGTFCESRIYLFASKESLDEFQKDPRRYVEEVRQAENPPHGAVR